MRGHGRQAQSRRDSLHYGPAREPQGAVGEEAVGRRMAHPVAGGKIALSRAGAAEGCLLLRIIRRLP
jgi:hypothetical protein